MKRRESREESGSDLAGPGLGRAPTPAYLEPWVSSDEELSALKLGRSQASQEEWVTLPGGHINIQLGSFIINYGKVPFLVGVAPSLGKTATDWWK